MRHLRNLKEVQFETLEELTEFVANLGAALFYNDWEGEYVPIRIDDDTEKAVIGSDGWDIVEESHLSNIYGFIPVVEA